METNFIAQITGLVIGIAVLNKETTQLVKWLLSKIRINVEDNYALILSALCALGTAWVVDGMGYMPNSKWYGVLAAAIGGWVVSSGLYKAWKPKE